MPEPSFETMRSGFDKLHLGDGRALHWITGPDGEEWHDHPMALTIRVLTGGYVEETLEGGLIRRRTVFEGDRFVIPAAHCHRIVEVDPLGCLTLCEYGSWERDTRFYRMRGGEVQSRAWDGDWS